MAQKEQTDSKFTPQSAEAAMKGNVKIEGKVITVSNSNGMGLNALAALDYLTKYCGGIVKFVRVPQVNFIPLELRGNIILNSSKVK